MVGSLFFASFSLLFCGLFCWYRNSKANVYSLMLKVLSSMCFVLSGVFAIHFAGSSNVNLLIIPGLVMGLIGDILLDLKLMYPEQSNQYFRAGTFAFTIGHFFYFLSAILYNNVVLPGNLMWNILASIGIAIIMTLAIVFTSKKMGLNFDKILHIVILYSFVLSFMVCFSIAIAIFNPIYWIFAIGMVAFLLSDIILSLQYFGNLNGKVWVYVNHFLYYIAQTMIAVSIMYAI